MRLTQNNITIELENEDEIRHFWNIIAFALDLQAIREKEGNPCMTDTELEMAQKLYDLTESCRWHYE